MKLVKRITLIMLLVLGFSLQCEIFQSECWNFSTGYYYSSTFSYINEEERIAFLEDIYMYAKDASVEIFSTDITSETEFKNQLIIYGSENVENIISQSYNMQADVYRSLISGETSIVYRDFFKLSDYENRFINRISFIGEEERIYSIYDKMCEKYVLEFPEIIGSSERDMMYITWVTIVLIMIVLTCIEILYSRKEMVLRISLGQAVRKLIIKEILEEVFFDVLIFLAVKTVVFQFISGEFMKYTVMMLFIIGIVLVCFCYISYGFYDIKKAFHNINDSCVILFFSYGLKCVVTVITIGVLSTNFNNVMTNALIDNEEGIVEVYGDYSYLSIRDKRNGLYGVGHGVWSEMEIYEKIFRDYYRKATPTIIMRELKNVENNLNYICVNEYGRRMLNDFIADETMLNGVDAVYYIPQNVNLDLVMEEAEYCLNMMIGDVTGLNVKVVQYDSKRYFSCIDTNTTYGMITVYNPVIVYSNYDGASDLEKISSSINGMDVKGIMFALSDADIEEINKRYGIDDMGFELVRTGVRESYEAHNSFVKKIIAFCSSLCVFAVIMQFILTVAVNNMQYRRNAIEISIKKIMGYSMWKRHRKILITSSVFYIIIIMMFIVASVFTRLLQPAICIIVGVFISALEFMVIIMNIIQIEKKNVQKTLKGGCL